MVSGTRFKDFIKCLVQLKGHLVVHDLRWGTFPTLFMDQFKRYIAIKLLSALAEIDSNDCFITALSSGVSQIPAL